MRILSVLTFYYAFLLSSGTFQLWTWATEPWVLPGRPRLPFVFNSMLLNLLAGRFDVDPAAVQWEAVVKDGRTYAYWGIVPALLRLPALPFGDLRLLDVSTLSCLVAVTLAAGCKLAALRAIVRRDAGATGEAVPGRLLRLVVIVTLLAGAQLQFLRVNVYQEVILWAGALAAAFVLVAVGGLVGPQGFSDRALVAMAALAGACLLTRASTGLGLSVAITALLAGLLRRESRADRAAWRRARFLRPVLVLAGLAALAAFVNVQRFDHPLRFHRPGLQSLTHPRGIPQLEQYGEFNARRLAYGAMYYVAPVWFLPDGAGGLLFGDFKKRTIDLVELPPSSFLLSDPLLLLLAAAGAACLLRRPAARGLDRTSAGLLAAGLSIPPLLMLVAMAMAFRYRMEFYPLLELLAFVGLAFSPALRRPTAWPRTLVVLCCVSVLVSHALLLVYKVSPLASLEAAVGIRGAYAERLERARARLGDLLRARP